MCFWATSFSRRIRQLTAPGRKISSAPPPLEKAFALDATFTPVLPNRAFLLARRGKTADALSLFDETLALNPCDPGILAGRAASWEVAGNLQDAAADYRRAVEILIGKP